MKLQNSDVVGTLDSPDVHPIIISALIYHFSVTGGLMCVSELVFN